MEIRLDPTSKTAPFEQIKPQIIGLIRGGERVSSGEVVVSRTGGCT